MVHGHTIIGDSPVVTGNRVSIDTGAYRSGLLSAAVFDGGPVRFLQARGEPDRGAIARETELVAVMRGHPVTPAMRAALAAYVAGGIDAAEMERRTRLEPV